jgi:hypothetical protein
MRFFSYISDGKVDMLLPQIPSGRRETIAAELGFNFALLSGKVSAEASTLDNRVARLLAVEKYILENETLNTADTDGVWLSDTAAAVSLFVEQGALLWAFKKNASSVVLAGSSSNVAGNAAVQATRTPYSSLAGIMTLVSQTAPDAIPYFDGAEKWPTSEGMRGDLSWLRELFEYVCERVGGPEQRIKFLARRLVSGRYRAKHLVLASPLYIELKQ